MAGYLNLSPEVPSDQEFLSGLLTWSTLKPIVVLLILACLIFSLYDPAYLIVLCVACGVIWVGTVMLGIDLIVIATTQCNSPYFPDSACNDLLYCCAYYDQVPSCAGLGPCTPSVTPSKLAMNSDFFTVTVFTGIFFFLELLLIVVSFGALTRMKVVYRDAVIENNALHDYYNGTLTQKYDLLLDSLSPRPPPPPQPAPSLAKPAVPIVSSSPITGAIQSAVNNDTSITANTVNATASTTVASKKQVAPIAAKTAIVPIKKAVTKKMVIKNQTPSPSAASSNRNTTMASASSRSTVRTSKSINALLNSNNNNNNNTITTVTSKSTVAHPKLTVDKESTIIHLGAQKGSSKATTTTTTAICSSTHDTTSTKNDDNKNTPFKRIASKLAPVWEKISPRTTELHEGTKKLLDGAKTVGWDLFLYGFYHMETFVINEMIHKPLEYRERYYCLDHPISVRRGSHAADNGGGGAGRGRRPGNLGGTVAVGHRGGSGVGGGGVVGDNGSKFTVSRSVTNKRK